MTEPLTVQEVARAARVTERTVYRWVEKSALSIWRTPTGRIRVVGFVHVGKSMTNDDKRRQSAK